jgi:hypothetical protein
MSSHHLRKEKRCLNCSNTVEQRYCGNCGQENIEPRQTFGHLLAHFFEDLTHYEGKFWGTLRHLFFKPAYLTKEFIAGKRNKYLPPVRLYIFASFITFLLMGIIPEAPTSSDNFKLTADSAALYHNHSKDSIKQVGVDMSKAIKDSLAKAAVTDTAARDTSGEIDFSAHYDDDGGISFFDFQKTMPELDSAKAARSSTADPMGFWRYKFNKKLIHFGTYPGDLREEMIVKAFGSNFPKALFVYMPLFALILRLFHRKRNWIYFDHGIFTLHFFSFTLLVFLAFVLLSSITEWVGYFTHTDFLDWISSLAFWVIMIWIPYYLFRAHRKMYEEEWYVSIPKVWGILFLNSILFCIVTIAFVLITFLTLN